MKATRNRNALKLEPTSKFGSHLNCVHINPANSLGHELKKLEVCFNLRSQNLGFYTETKFLNGTRADIYCVDNDKAYEIVCSEKEASIARKKKDYPCDIVVIKVWEMVA